MQSMYIISNDSEPEDILPSLDRNGTRSDVTLMFQTGYPYIGVPINTFRYIMFRYIETDIQCNFYSNFGDCSWDEPCESLIERLPKHNMSIGVDENYQFVIPFDNLLTGFINEENERSCKLAIGLMPKAEYLIVLGDSFFTGFVGIFDPVNKQLGIAKSARSLPGTTMVCHNSTACSEPIPPAPKPDPKPDPDPKPEPP